MSKQGSVGTIYNSLAYYGSNGGVIGKIESTIINEFKSFLHNLESASLTIISSPFENTNNKYAIANKIILYMFIFSLIMFIGYVCLSI